jgi:hypothetical protein
MKGHAKMGGCFWMRQLLTSLEHYDDFWVGFLGTFEAKLLNDTNEYSMKCGQNFSTNKIPIKIKR